MKEEEKKQEESGSEPGKQTGSPPASRDKAALTDMGKGPSARKEDEALPGMRSSLKSTFRSGNLKTALTAHKKEVAIILFSLLLIAGVLGSYLFYKSDTFSERRGGTGEKPGEQNSTSLADLISIKVYYPFGGGLKMESRRILKSDSKNKLAEAVLTEYLKGPADADSYVPEGSELLGIYSGTDGVLYIDISHEFRSNFQGDALAEFLLLRGLYESIVSNVPDLKGLKVLIEGKEVESIGGHISLPGTLGEAVSHILLERNEKR